jgi:hypothetical protein
MVETLVAAILGQPLSSRNQSEEASQHLTEDEDISFLREDFCSDPY